MPYARLLQQIRVMGELRAEDAKERRIWDAFLSWRAHPPTYEGAGGKRQVVEFNTFLAQLGLAEEKEIEAPEISNEEFERMMGRGRVGLTVMKNGQVVELTEG